jgi:putative addiction module component (TIGR02574 family)
MAPLLSAPEIEKLSVPQKLEMIEILWDSIPDSLDSLPIPEWHKQILNERLAEADASPEANIPWEQVRSELRRRP